MGALGNITVVAGTFLAGLAVLVLLCWAWLLLRLLRRGHNPRRPLTLGTLAVLLTLALAADLVNSYYSYLPNVSDVLDAAEMNAPAHYQPGTSPAPRAPVRHGELVRLRIPDRGSGFGRTDAWVWLPAVYFSQPARRLPVVYVFHGSPGQPKDWFHGGNAGRIAATEPAPVIVVAPQLSKNWLDDSECVDGIHEKVETHLLRDVIPTVDAQLRTIPTRAGRIFAGMSAGGFCALNLGLRHRDLTATVLDFSGETRPTHAGGERALFGADTTAAAQNSPASYAGSLHGGPPMRIWLDCGTDDRSVLSQLRAIAPVLRADGMTVQLHVRPGGHSYSVWRPAFAASLRWALTS
ncbi:MAG TPA: alpha/beta hydrolase-fold protein [Jatrophihabitans sp.]|nr:alpha/beta hydrolase-fold protein [Jatrophihabitans sp.]